MRITLAIAAVGTFVLTATIGVSTAGDSDGVKPTPVTVTQPATANSQFATMKTVKAIRITPAEMDKIKGQHVHFLDHNGGFHLAGNPEKNTKNWSNLGGTDGAPVAPSYHGLCVAHSVGGIFIPTRGAITTECPAP